MTAFFRMLGVLKRARGPVGLPLALIIAMFAVQNGVAQTPAEPAHDGVSTPGASPLFKEVIAQQERAERLLDEYERVVRTEMRKPGSDGNPPETKTWRAFPMGTGAYKIPMSPEGKPPQPESYRQELEKLEKYLVWLVQDGSAQKEAYAKAERKKKERFDLLEATYQAFIFTKDGEEQRGGSTLIRYNITPNPKYHPTSRNTTLFTKVRGTIWIDEESRQMAKIDGSVIEDISLALFLAKVYRGSHFMQERYEVAPGVWEPTFEQYDFDGRKFLSSFSIHERTFYSSYKHVGAPKEAIDVVRGELNKLGTQESSR